MAFNLWGFFAQNEVCKLIFAILLVVLQICICIFKKIAIIRLIPLVRLVPIVNMSWLFGVVIGAYVVYFTFPIFTSAPAATYVFILALKPLLSLIAVLSVSFVFKRMAKNSE